MRVSIRLRVRARMALCSLVGFDSSAIGNVLCSRVQEISVDMCAACNAVTESALICALRVMQSQEAR